MFVEIPKILRTTTLCIFLFPFTSLFIAGCNGSNHDKKIIAEEYIHLGETNAGIATVATGLNVPWEIAWGPGNRIWITEQHGTISRIDPANGTKKILLTIPEVWMKRSTGLLGMALSRDMKKEPYVFVDYTFLKDSIPFSKLVRYTYSNDTLIDPLTLLEIPASGGHNGSRVAVSPDGKVIWATGDAQKDGAAQDTTSLNGKILRINMDGTIPDDNPFKGSPVWAWGFRNMQGLAYSSNGNLYTSEHGDATDDEINLIRKGEDYGYPDVLGMPDLPAEKLFQEEHHTIDPLKIWTPTIAPAGLDYYDNKAIPEWSNSLLLTTLKTQSLRVLKLDKTGTAITSQEVYLSGEYGRLRDLCISPDGDVYVSTSNRDWNPGPGFPKENDDRIIKIFKIKKGDPLPPKESFQLSDTLVKSASATTYTQYCSSCHKEDGKGVTGIFPALDGSAKVNGDEADLIKLVLNGVKPSHAKAQAAQENNMPSFSFLNDKDIAGVLTYIRSNWSNHSKEINEDKVAQVRKMRQPVE